jgi:type I restriction enzyme S subunit
MMRFASGGLQGHVNLTILEELEIPKIKLGFQLEVEAIIKLAFSKRHNSKQTYTAAEEILLQEIGLKDFTPSNDPVNIKNLSESFTTSGRLDAEYYQRKYEQVVNKITSQSYDTLENLVTITKSIEPGSAHYAEEGLPFLRVADYSKFGLTEPQKYLSSDFVTDNQKLIERLKPKKGTILFSKDGSVGTAYHLRNDVDGITSGAILHLKVKDTDKIIPEYLTLALNSKLVQMQAERDAGGSIILHWRVSEIENVVVPVIDYTKQTEIAALIEQSFTLKKQSEHLLETAKRAVEIAIEENEDAALDYIKENS